MRPIKRLLNLGALVVSLMLYSLTLLAIAAIAALFPTPLDIVVFLLLLALLVNAVDPDP